MIETLCSDVGHSSLLPELSHRILSYTPGWRITITLQWKSRLAACVRLFRSSSRNTTPALFPATLTRHPLGHSRVVTLEGPQLGKSVTRYDISNSYRSAWCFIFIHGPTALLLLQDIAEPLLSPTEILHLASLPVLLWRNPQRRAPRCTLKSK